jgi:hypothetical protein
MKTRPNTDIAIEDLVNAVCGENATFREKYVYREALRGLVRLAKSETMLEMRTSVDKLAGAIAARAARRQARAIIREQRLPYAAVKQTQLEFNN